jgi:hypothetical protein
MGKASSMNTFYRTPNNLATIKLSQSSGRVRDVLAFLLPKN